MTVGSMWVEAVEVGDDFLPGFEGVASDLEGGAHEVVAGCGADEVVSYEQVWLVGKNDMVVDGCVEILL